MMCTRKGRREMKFDKNRLNQPWAAYTFAACCAVLLYLFLSHINLLGIGLAKLYSFIRPVFIGLVIAYILNPLAMVIRRGLAALRKPLPLPKEQDAETLAAYRLKEKRRDRNLWNVTVAITIVLVVFFFIVLLVALIPQIVRSIGTLISNLGVYMDTASKLLENLNKAASSANLDIGGITNFVQDGLNQLVDALTQNSGIVDTVTGIGSGIFNGVISFIISIYFLLDKSRLLAGCRKLARLLISEKRYPAVSSFWKRCNHIMVRYIASDILDGLFVGCANAVFMIIARMPYIPLISVVVGITNLAPTFGPIVGAVIGAFILVLANPWQALWFLIFTLILQTCDGYVVKPKLFGDTLGVPSIWILISIIVFGRMWGVVGILLAIPIAAITDFIWHDYLMRKLEERRQKRTAKAEAARAKQADAKQN